MNENDLLAAAYAIGINPTWLANVISLESDGNPRAYNPVSGAVGLIQFMPRTLKDMGLLSAAMASRIPATGAVPDAVKTDVKNEFLARYPDSASQLRGPVVRYMKQWAPFPTEQSAYMAVFYPAYRYVSPDTTFSSSIQKQNPGIYTVADYVSLVKKKSQPKT